MKKKLSFNSKTGPIFLLIEGGLIAATLSCLLWPKVTIPLLFLHLFLLLLLLENTRRFMLHIQREPERRKQWKRTFESHLNHKIRTPLTNILGIVDICLDENFPKDHKENLATIKASSEEILGALANQFEDLASSSDSKVIPFPASKNAGTSTNRILVAEDNEDNQKIAIAFFKKKGYDIHIANNGQEAVRMVQSKTYDFVFMDIEMPVMDGMTATRTIRDWEKRRGRRTTIIAMTADSMKGDRERFLACGMDDYISKPIDRNQLYALLDRYQVRKAA